MLSVKNKHKLSGLKYFLIIVISIVAIIVFYFVLLFSLFFLSYYYKVKISETNLQYRYKEAVQYCKKYDFVNDLIFNKMKSLTRGKNEINYKDLIEAKDILGETYLNFQNYSAAKKIYEQILSDIEKHSISDDDYINNVKRKLLNSYINLGYYDKVIDITSSNDKFKYFFVEANLFKKNNEIVEKYLFSKEEKDFGFLKFLYYIEKKQYKEAERFIQENKDYNKGLNRIFLGNLYGLEAEYDKAKSILKPFYEIDSFKNEVPVKFKIFYKYGYAYLLEMTGDSNAERVYKEILDLNGSGYGYEGAINILCSKYRFGKLRKDVGMQNEAIKLFQSIDYSEDKYAKDDIANFCKLY